MMLNSDRDTAVKERNHTLDFLRVVCILFIVITHTGWNPTEVRLYGWSFHIQMAVPIFMILSGYASAMSFEGKSAKSFHEAYSADYVVKRLVRFTMPFVPVWIAEIVVSYTKGILSGMGGLQALHIFQGGGSGPGSYYYPIMIQFIFLFPILYFLIVRHGSYGLILSFFKCPI